MPSRRFVRHQGKTSGPFSEEELRSMIADGRLQPESLVSVDGRKWLRAGRSNGLFPAPPPLPIKAPPVTPPPPPALPPADVGNAPARFDRSDETEPAAARGLDRSSDEFRFDSAASAAELSPRADSRRRVPL